MIWERCCIQTVRLGFDNLKYYINSSNKGIASIEYNVNATFFSSKLIPSTYMFSYKKMSSTSSNYDTKEYQNKLAFEKSPYLLQHASNPINWYPWGEEALLKARREDKLIFLSVGYSTCHWCHVMEKESFKNSDVANIMNKYFVNIKVDREERPDIDKVYMTFIQSITGHGGWPMNVFLTPTLTPITGGTYFPPTDSYGQPGFKRVLESIALKWIENKQELINSGSKMIEVLKKAVQSKSQIECNIPTIDCANTCVKQLLNEFEPKFGGFSKAPKFPQPVNFNLLFLMYTRDPEDDIGKQCFDMCIHTLKKMANGGIHDHIGQGFSRYSVDAKWHVPHFEKMLYDQAQLLRLYADAYLISNDLFFAEITNDIATYVLRDLRHSEGGFYSAEDADSLPTFTDKEKKEGAFYVWTYEEIKSVLDNIALDKETITLFDIFCYHFNIKPEGNVKGYQDPHGELTNKNVLIVYGGIAETAAHFKLNIDLVKFHLQKSLNILYNERKKRPTPHLDDKIVTAWNGLMISGLSRVASVLDNPEYVEHAENTAKFIERYLYDQENNILLRSCYHDKENKIQQANVPIKGFQVDYAFVIQGLLDLYKVSFNPHWLEFAENLQNVQDNLFWDDNNGGYFSTTKYDSSVILRLKDEQDGAEPSGNSVACGNLIKLASYLDRTDLFDKANKLLNSMQDTLKQFPISCPELVTNLVNFIDSITQIYIIGKKDADDTKKLLKVVQKKFLPGKIIMLADGEFSTNILYRKNKVIDKMKQQNGRATAYVCHHHVCSLPVTDPEELSSLLEKKRADIKMAKN